MQTLYIDVYFLINFVIDLIAIFFASAFLKVPVRPVRFLLASALLALYACIYLFLPRSAALFLLSGGAVLLLVTLICTARMHFFRRVRFAAVFFVTETLLGGTVHYIYQKLDEVSGELFSDLSDEIESRSFLIFSVIVLLSVGVLRLIGTLLGGADAERHVGVVLTYSSRSVSLDALVDTGNLLRDPMDNTPVMLVKESALRGLFPSELYLEKYELCERELRRCIRLIPIDTQGGSRLLTGVRMDNVKILAGKRTEHIFVTVAIDKEEGSYGGYDALMPQAALEHVF